MIICLPFASQQSFLDPLLTNDGKLYAPLRYKRILQDVYTITRNTNIDYKSVMDMSVTEREYIMSFLIDEAKAIKKHTDEVQQKMERERQTKNKK